MTAATVPGAIAAFLRAHPDPTPPADHRRHPRAFVASVDPPPALAPFIADPVAERGKSLPLEPPGGHLAALRAAMAMPPRASRR